MFRCLSVITICLLVSAAVIKSSEPLTVDPESIPDGSSHQATIEGRIADRGAKVWVVVHPVGLDSYYVQPEATVSDNHTWTATIYLGRPGDKGKFEIKVFANPKAELVRGQELTNWPPSSVWSSKLIVVTRK